MKNIRNIFFASMLGAAMVAPALHAQPAAQSAAQPVAQTAAMTDGEIRKVDKENAKVTIRHGEIRNLEMPAMTMVFHVKDAAMLDQLKPGDKVRFVASNDGGKLTVTEIRSVP